ncbi:hypothetical protein Tco_1426638 [Tanacetum coccineum]
MSSGAQDQARNSAMVVPVLETAVPHRVPLAPHQIPSRISMAHNQYTRTYRYQSVTPLNRVATEYGSGSVTS